MNILIIGCGNLGSVLANEFDRNGHDVSVVDENPDRIHLLHEDFDGLFVTGIAMDMDVLRDAGVESCDAAINPGNSGGALINSYSQIIGINTSKLVSEEYEGMGFAIPSNTVISIVNNIIRNGYVKGRAYLGITASEWSTYAAKKNDTPVGVKIESLSEENAFSGSDVQIGDIITEIDGKTIKDLSSMFDAIDEHKPGDRISIKLFRLKNFNSDGKAKSFSVSVVLLEDTGQ